MATNSYKNAMAISVGTSLVDVYTCPGATVATVIGLCISNKTSDSVFVDVKIYDSSATATCFLIKQAPIPVGGSLVVIGGDQKVILEAGDKIQAQSETAAALDIFVSLVQLA